MANGVSQDLIQKGALFFFRNTGRRISRKMLQDELGISKATACRLITEISTCMGLAEEDPSENNTIHYFLPEDSANDIGRAVMMLPVLTDSDRMMLTLMLSQAKRSPAYDEMASSLEDHLGKIGAILTHSGKGSMLPVYSLNGLSQKLQDNAKGDLSLLFEAIRGSHPVEMTYRSPYAEEPKTYTLWPMNVFLQDGNLYLYSYHPGREDTLINACSRIVRISMLAETFVVPKQTPGVESLDDPFGIGYEAPQRVKVWIDPDQAFFEKEKQWPEDAVIEEKDDGSIEIAITIRNKWAFERWVLSMGCQARVVGPQEIVDEMRENLRLMNEAYGDQ